jgi:hypothetical protein
MPKRHSIDDQSDTTNKTNQLFVLGCDNGGDRFIERREQTNIVKNSESNLLVDGDNGWRRNQVVDHV